MVIVTSNKVNEIDPDKFHRIIENETKVNVDVKKEMSRPNDCEINRCISSAIR